MAAHGHFLTEGTAAGGRKRSPYARNADVERLIKAAKKAGLDVGGFEALPDGTIRIFTEKQASPASLFDQLARAGKL